MTASGDDSEGVSRGEFEVGVVGVGIVGVVDSRKDGGNDGWYRGDTGRGLGDLEVDVVSGAVSSGRDWCVGEVYGVDSVMGSSFVGVVDTVRFTTHSSICTSGGGGKGPTSTSFILYVIQVHSEIGQVIKRNDVGV